MREDYHIYYENEEERQIAELECLYEIANVLPGFLEENEEELSVWHPEIKM